MYHQQLKQIVSNNEDLEDVINVGQQEEDRIRVLEEEETNDYYKDTFQNFQDANDDAPEAPRDLV